MAAPTKTQPTVTITDLDALPAVLTAQQLGEALQIPAATIYDLGQQGKLPRVKLGRLVRFKKSDVLDFLARSSSVPTPTM